MGKEVMMIFLKIVPIALQVVFERRMAHFALFADIGF